VQVVLYQLSQSNLANCPCTLQRGQVSKLDGTAPEAQPLPVLTTEVDNIINPSTEALFRYYDIDGNEITGLPMTFDSTKSNGGTIATVFTIKISVTAAAAYTDVQNKLKPEVTFTATAQMNN
jgi:hypothetical protein